jgi:hypothetical protein
MGKETQERRLFLQYSRITDDELQEVVDER